jgi:hypothetical protein
LCVNCGVRRLLSDICFTLVFGWWGLISMFRAPWTLMKNGWSLFTFSRAHRALGVINGVDVLLFGVALALAPVALVCVPVVVYAVLSAIGIAGR